MSASKGSGMKVNKAWQFLLVHPTKGYYTGYKGQEMFGDLERAKIYRTRDEAFMDTLAIPYKLEFEQVLIWHRTLADVGPREVSFGKVSNQEASNRLKGIEHLKSSKSRMGKPYLKLVQSN